MNKKSLLTFLIVGIGIILVGWNLVQKNNPRELNPKRLRQLIKNDLCLDLNKEECLNNDDCRSVYGSSFCSGGVCTTDQVFKRCEEIPANVLERAEQDKVLCQKTGGEWKSSKRTKLGGCECQQSYFRENEGCMSMVDDCEKLGGTIYEPGTLRCNDHLRKIDRSTCPKKTKFNIFKECLCPNGETWDYKNRCS